MRIDRIDLYHVSMPLLTPWRTAYGEDPAIHSVLVKLTSGDTYGWGETTPLKAPCYSPEWAHGVYTLLATVLAPHIVGHEIEHPRDLLALLAPFKGNPFAKAGLEIAFWVLKAKTEGKPLHQCLGGRAHPVAVGADFGVQDRIETLLIKIQRAIDAGYPRVKLKFRVGWDLDVVQAVRNAFPDLTVHIDCNAAFTLKHMALFKQVDRLDLAMIEQPLHHTDLLDHATLQKAIHTPICLDESITSPRSAMQAIHLESCQYMNIKTGRVGGLLNAVTIHDLCADAGIPCWVGGMLESAVGSGVSAELATLPNFQYPADIFPSTRLYPHDLADPEITLCAPGKVAVSTVPGTPYEPRADRLHAQTLHTTRITP